MVTFIQSLVAGGRATVAQALTLLAEVQQQRPLEKLDPLTRTKAIAALVGLVILGLGMMALAWLGARFTRRYMNSGSPALDRADRAIDADRWAAKPLVSSPSVGKHDD